MRWIIGDIHGMLRPLEALLDAIPRHDAAAEILFVGDYVNRGPDSKAVIDLLLSLTNAHFVRGNHDDVFDQVLSGLSYASKPTEASRVQSFRWFMQHGLDKTLLSYGIKQSEMTRALQKPSNVTLDDLVEPVPAAHRGWLRGLPIVIERDDLFVAHAKWDAYIETEDPPIAERLGIAESLGYNLLWGRYRTDEIAFDKPWGRTGYFGHTPVDSYRNDDALIPVAGPRIILLDTAAALVAHGRLTAFCHESQAYLQADVSGKIVGA